MARGDSLLPWRVVPGGSLHSVPLPLSLDDVLSMEHDERHIWLREIARINKEINEARKRDRKR